MPFPFAVLGLINIEQNEIVKIFTVAAVVFMPPTLIDSIYGMNFAHMPGLENEYGYYIALVVMLVSIILPPVSYTHLHFPHGLFHPHKKSAGDNRMADVQLMQVGDASPVSYTHLLNDSFLESVINDIEFHKKDFLLFPVYPLLARR